MTTGSTGSVFPKWQLAILVGAPVALGLSYMYYRNQSSKYSDKDVDGETKKKLGDLRVNCNFSVIFVAPLIFTETTVVCI